MVPTQQLHPKSVKGPEKGKSHWAIICGWDVWLCWGEESLHRGTGANQIKGTCNFFSDCGCPGKGTCNFFITYMPGGCTWENHGRDKGPNGKTENSERVEVEDTYWKRASWFSDYKEVAGRDAARKPCHRKSMLFPATTWTLHC